MILSYRDKTPDVDPTAFIAEGASVIGDVTLGADASIWFGCVLRGDVNTIRIGARTNIQDLTVVHVNHGDQPTIIEEEVTVGHRVILHGCRVKKGALIGMGAILLDGVVVEERALVAAGSVVSPGTIVPSGKLARGVPARVARDLTEEELQGLVEASAHYCEIKNDYLKQRGVR